MNRKVTGLAGAVGLAGFGTLVLVGYVQAAEDRAVAGERLVPVLVVDAPVDKGTTADELAAVVRREEVPAKVRASGAVDDLADLDGLAATTDLVPGEQVIADRFAPASSVAPSGVPDGFQRMTVALEPQRAVGGAVKPGSHVAVFASFESPNGDAPRTELVLDDVPVVSVGPGPALSSDDKGTVTGDGSLLVTLAVAPTDAARLVTGAEGGKIWLTGIDGLADAASVAS